MLEMPRGPVRGRSAFPVYHLKMCCLLLGLDQLLKPMRDKVMTKQILLSVPVFLIYVFVLCRGKWRLTDNVEIYIFIEELHDTQVLTRQIMTFVTVVMS